MSRDPFVITVGEYAVLNCGLLPDDPRPIIVALSGGADSVALLSVLVDLGYKCIAAHCNYHLRGDESNRDASHAKNIAKNLGVEFLQKDFDVDAFRKATNESSVENACRVLRYNWFADLMQEYCARAVAVGHNSDDNCETVLFNLFRGTGLKGLRGIQPVNENNIVRPLLSQSRQSIEDYLRRINLGYVIDSTNLQSQYSRNRIRNIILPEIDKCFPNARKGIAITTENVYSQELLYNQLIAEKLQLYSIADGCLDLKSLISNEAYPAMLLFEWENGNGLTYTQAENIISSVNNTGAKFYSDNFVWTVNRGSLLRNAMTLSTSLDFESEFHIEVHPASDFKIENKPDKAYFDVAVFEGDDLDVRYARSGDRISPFGMKGKKKVFDVMAEKGVPLHLKNRIPLLVKGNDILWIPGVRASSLYSVTPESKSFVTVTWRNPLKF